MIKGSFTLYNGVEIPALGFGTWQIPNDVAEFAVKDALEVGYRHIDTAALYQNEKGVGKGIRDFGIPREEIFLTTKISAFCKTYEDTLKAIDDSLENLGTDYIDLMLIHAPRPFNEMFEPTGKTYNEENLEVWKSMTEAYNVGKFRAIGVSNFSEEDLDNIIQNSKVKPMVNQVLVNITHYPRKLIEECKKRGILVASYSPNATGKLKGSLLEEMAEKYGYTLPQLGNRFDYQLGTVVLPKSTNKEHMAQNLNIDTEISEEDMKILMSLGQYEGWKGADSE